MKAEFKNNKLYVYDNKYNNIVQDIDYRTGKPLSSIEEAKDLLNDIITNMFNSTAVTIEFDMYNSDNIQTKEVKANELCDLVFTDKSKKLNGLMSVILISNDNATELDINFIDGEAVVKYIFASEAEYSINFAGNIDSKAALINTLSNTKSTSSYQFTVTR